MAGLRLQRVAAPLHPEASSTLALGSGRSCGVRVRVRVRLRGRDTEMEDDVRGRKRTCQPLPTMSHTEVSAATGGAQGFAGMSAEVRINTPHRRSSPQPPKSVFEPPGLAPMLLGSGYNQDAPGHGPTLSPNVGNATLQRPKTRHNDSMRSHLEAHPTFASLRTVQRSPRPFPPFPSSVN